MVIFLDMDRGEKEGKGFRVNVKQVHITLENITNKDKQYWIEKARAFRVNVAAVLVGVEENHQERKGVHAHIVIQFTTQQKLSRKQFMDHFGTDAIHIAPKPDKNALVMALGYVSKTGNTAQWGEFVYRGMALDADPEVYRFNYMVKDIDGGLAYFKKAIDENLSKDKNLIKKYAKRKDAIGTWLQKHKSHAKTLIDLADAWHLDYINSRKENFKARAFAKDPVKLRKVYRAYLKLFPDLYKKNIAENNNRELEKDYEQYEEHDLERLMVILSIIEKAIKYGPNRPHKSLNLHIWSKLPGFGKSRLMKFLNANTMTYRLPKDQYYVSYKNGIYKVLVSDEAEMFLSTKKYFHLKLLLEGQGVEFNRKQKEKVVKKDNPLILLASNKPFDGMMRGLFKDRHEVELMKDRVRDIELKSRASLHFLCSCIFGWDEDNPKMVELPSKVLGLPLLKAMEGTQGGKEAIA